MKDYHVLVIGPRRGLIDELRERRIPFSLWQERFLFNVARGEKSVTAPLWSSPEKIREQVRKSFPGSRFTHVIAGTESAVLPAAVARRQVGARLSNAATGSRCRDKLLMKQYLTGFGIPMTRFMADTDATNAEQVFAALGSPVVRKQRKSSGGKGLQLLRSPEDLVQGKTGHCILERFVNAPEASVESFVDRGRIRFTNITEYHRKGHCNFVPAVLEPELKKTLLALNERVISALGIGWGMTHLEVYLTERGPLFGEIALRPPGGYIMNAISHAWDFNPWAAFLAMELGEAFEFPLEPTAYAASEVLYPGAGRVRAIRGKAQVLDEQGIREFRLKLKLGEILSPRAGLGQDTGYIVHASATAEERLALHERITKQLVIELDPVEG
ncbi:MAG: ATP-grasp domain-containing protein [Pseudomonadales bacterium]|nr:ATP-grasp domain-containing protein [Pseudomonadales bacterium]MCP5358338.1 ATP-grasp domain-containing protein [Pseudomonadales bacterium]